MNRATNLHRRRRRETDVSHRCASKCPRCLRRRTWSSRPQDGPAATILKGPCARRTLTAPAIARTRIGQETAVQVTQRTARHFYVPTNGPTVASLPTIEAASSAATAVHPTPASAPRRVQIIRGVARAGPRSSGIPCKGPTSITYTATTSCTASTSTGRTNKRRTPMRCANTTSKRATRINSILHFSRTPAPTSTRVLLTIRNAKREA